MFLIRVENDTYCSLAMGFNVGPLIYRVDSNVLGFKFKEIEDGISETDSNYHKHELSFYLEHYRVALNKYKKLVSLL